MPRGPWAHRSGVSRLRESEFSSSTKPGRNRRRRQNGCSANLAPRPNSSEGSIMICRALATLSVLLAAWNGLAAAQNPKNDDSKKDEPPAKELKLRWYGQSFFQLETANRFRIVFD